MKKTILGALAAAPLILSSLASCSNLYEPGGGQTQEVKLGCSVINHLTPYDSSKEILLTKGDYSVVLNGPKRTASISTSNLKFGNTDHTFATKEMTLGVTGYTMGTSYGEIYSFSGRDGNLATANAEITNLSAKVTPFGYCVKTYVPGYIQYSAMPMRLVMSYQYDSEYTVKTIAADSFYGMGKTVATYPGEGGASQTYETENPFYRLVLDVDKMKADVIIYDAQFAPQMPKMTAMIVKGLTLTPTRDGFTASGENITPETVEGGMVTPFPNFPFNTIEVRSKGGDMTQVDIEYTVAGRFTGKFTGSNAFTGQ